MDVSSQPTGSNTSKTPCRICGRPKTPWSDKCKRCEGNRQKYLNALARQQEDIEFLAFLAEAKQQGLSYEEIGKARTPSISRQRVQQLKADAEARVQFLHQHKPPRLAFMQ